MYPVSARFHQIATADSPVTRCRIYFIPDTVDCTDDNDVQTNGTLLVRNPGDTDSNGRISEKGISFSDLYNTDKNIQIGGTVSKAIQLSLMNQDGALSGFAFGRCKVYIDVYDEANSTWLTCPMGVYVIDMPVKRSALIVAASGYDQMQNLNQIADAWWNNIDFESGITLSTLISDIATQCGVQVSSDLNLHILNSNKTYNEAPMTANRNTFKDILGQIAALAGGIAFFDRDGALDIRWFSTALLNGVRYTLDADAIGSGVFQIDVADYAVTPIDALEILSFDTDLNAFVGDGSNVYSIAGNPFIVGADADEVETLVTPVYNRLITLGAYSPISMRLIADWSIEASDIIGVVRNGNTVTFPVMQQTMEWRGGFVLSSMQSDGDAERKPQEPNTRAEYRDGVQMHEFQNTANELLSRIQDLSGNFSLIQQTINAIEQTVSSQGTTIQSILDPTGQIWTAIKTNASNLSTVESALNDEVSERKSYIRFIPAEPAIVIGVDTGNEIKLKLVNNIIYFFNGSDDSTDLSLAYAYFNSEEAGADRFVATESVQIGNSDSSNRWLWKMLSNGDLVLDLI